MTVSIIDDFNLEKIANSGQCFRVRMFEDHTYRFVTGDQVLYIKEIEDTLFEISCDEIVWGTVWCPYFDLSKNYRELRDSVNAADHYLQKAAAYGNGIRILRQDAWETLITFIISQRKSIPAIRASVELLSQKYGTLLSSPQEDIYRFPTPEQLSKASDAELRECKMGYRAPYILDAVDQVLHHGLDLTSLAACSDEDLFQALKQVKGVGDKVANCICLFAYNRTSRAPIDTWIHKVIEQEYGGKDPFPQYGANAGVMQQYIFYYAQTHKRETGKKHTPA